MDSGPTLVALDALVTVLSAAGRRQIPLADLFVGPRKTALKPEELLVEIIIPKTNLGKPTAFQKFGLRKGQALALVNAAASLWVDWDKNVFVAPRVALGAVAPKVIRAPSAETFLDGRAITPEAMAEAGRLAVADAKPISDFRAVRRLPARSDRRADQTSPGSAYELPAFATRRGRPDQAGKHEIDVPSPSTA